MGAPATVIPGAVLGGKYRVERVLGAGGMGLVVAARHIELGQRVALKVMLREALEDPANAERFAREARAAVRLQSAHAARVLDVGKLANGEPFIVMEYLDGQDLDALLQSRGPLPPHLAVDYMLQACVAFAEAHGIGMVHRDIKLRNLFLARTVDGEPLVKVLDFGLAKMRGNTAGISLTATSAVFGSPQYMSPEQMRSTKDVDARSDIWSIGVCLYELLTGRVPFDAMNVAETCAMVLKDPVQPPSRWVPGLPSGLDAVVVKCLAKAPEDRYASVVDLAHALEPWSGRDGTARRIRRVMQTAERGEGPTIPRHLESPAAAVNGPPVRTGETTRQRMRRLASVRWVRTAFAVSVLCLAGAVTLVWRQALRPRSRTSASATTPAETLPGAEHAPSLAPSAEPTSVVASPDVPAAPTASARVDPRAPSLSAASTATKTRPATGTAAGRPTALKAPPATSSTKPTARDDM